MHPKASICTGRLVQGNRTSLLHLCITLFVKESASSVDCSTFQPNPAEAIWTASNFAFYESDVFGTIGDRRDVDALIHFMSMHRDLYIDQVNVLEIAEHDTRREIKNQGLTP